ncbi:MAG: alpha-ketoglutarate-dependent dioxygenase AlkB [Terriglobales bacterium]
MRRKGESPAADLPEGFLYAPEFLSETEEEKLLHELAVLPFEQFVFQGYLAKRRIVAYGWDYDFSSRQAAETQPIPEYLVPLRRRVAEFAGVDEFELVEAVVTEYSPGAPIGWHRDVPQFADVIGISLGSSCRMRFKPYSRSTKKSSPGRAEKAKIISITLEPRSVYLLRGAARWQWQHSIPAVERLRYSITFRTLRKKLQNHEAA